MPIYTHMPMPRIFIRSHIHMSFSISVVYEYAYVIMLGVLEVAYVTLMCKLNN
jgi:hypothetical protein